MDLNDIAGRITATVTEIVGTDAALLRGYSEAKVRSIAHFTLLLGEAYVAGEITSDQLRREREELDRMVARFVRNIQALTATTAERLIGGITGLIAGLLRGFAGAGGLVLPDLVPAP